MRIRDLKAHLEGCDEKGEVFVRISLDFLDGHPELLAGFDVVWSDHFELDLSTSVRLGDLAFQGYSEETMDEPCDGCPLAKASEWLFEHVNIDELIEEFCDRPLNFHRCCFVPQPPFGDDGRIGSGTHGEAVGDLPF